MKLKPCFAIALTGVTLATTLSAQADESSITFAQEKCTFADGTKVDGSIIRNIAAGQSSFIVRDAQNLKMLEIAQAYNLPTNIQYQQENVPVVCTSNTGETRSTSITGNIVKSVTLSTNLPKMR